MTADGPMSAPGDPGQARDFAKRRQTVMFSLKMKRQKVRLPGKRRGSRWLQCHSNKERCAETKNRSGIHSHPTPRYTGRTGLRRIVGAGVGKSGAGTLVVARPGPIDIIGTIFSYRLVAFSDRKL